MFMNNKVKMAGNQPATSSPNLLNSSNPIYTQQLSLATSFEHNSPNSHATPLPDADRDGGISPISPMPPSLPPIQRVSSIRSVNGREDGDGMRGTGHVRLGSSDSWFRTVTGFASEEGQLEDSSSDMQINFSRPRRDTGGSSISSSSRFHFRRESDESWVQHANDLRPIREEAREMSMAESNKSAAQATVNGSPLHSRPPTAESLKRTHYPASDSSSFRGGVTGNGSNAPSIVMMGTLQEPITSPSKFPIDSHRMPPKPPMHSFVTAPILGPPPKPQKGRLSFLNKFKRRAGSASDIDSEDGIKRGAYPGLPDNYDPSIRGNRIHDFSAPRAPAIPTNRLTYSSPSYRTDGRDISGIGWAEEYKPNRHTPVFKEHFDDAPHSDGAGVRAEALANRDFIARNSGPLPPPPPARSAPPPPPIQTSFPISKQNDGVSPVSDLSATQSLPDDSLTMMPLSPVAEDPTDFEPQVQRQSAIHRRGSSGRVIGGRHISASSKKSRLSSSSISSLNFPAHMDSRASRFSFQLVSKDSAAQERMLEERHKEREEREAARKLAQKNAPVEEDYEDDDYDFEDMDDFEEDVPTIGEDWSYGGGLGNMTLEDTILAPAETMHPLKGNSIDFGNIPVKSPIQGLGILPGTDVDGIQPSVYVPSGAPFQPQLGSVRLNEESYDGDDDLYFDDGLIDEVNFDDTEKFDESVLDDPNHPLYERKAKMPDQQTDIPIVPGQTEKNPVVSVLDFTTNPNSSPEALEHYHNILAMAAVKAAEAGRFTMEDDTTPHSEPSLTTDESRTSKATTVSPPIAAQLDRIDKTNKTDSPIQNAGAGFQLPHGYDDYSFASDLSDYDSAFEEDPIIAAANADALANDEEGIYGSEFGFYARPGPDSNEEAISYNGGYFGPKAWGEVKRQRSTREPNLTPITERSEYSARNSFASLNTLADKILGSPNSVGANAASPGIAQLARISTGSWDADKNLEALMKLRRGAFGGSQGSLRSVNSGRQLDSSHGHPSSPLVTSSAGSFMPRSSTGFSPRPDSNSRFKEIGTVDNERGDVLEIGTNSDAATKAMNEEKQEWQDDVEDSDYSDTSEQGDDDFINSVNTTGIQSGHLGYHANNSILNNNGSYEVEKQPMPQQFVLSVQQPTPLLAVPDSPPPSEPSSTTSAPGDSSMFQALADLKRPLPSYTAHRPPPLNTSLQPPPLPKGASGTFYSPASTITTEVSSPTKSVISPIKSTVGSFGRGTGGKKPSHSRQGSDTVAYTQEKDEETGEYRWVLERRRTGEDGVESLIGRAVVENGTI